jgi:hypothetical protein
VDRTAVLRNWGSRYGRRKVLPQRGTCIRQWSTVGQGATTVVTNKLCEWYGWGNLCSGQRFMGAARHDAASPSGETLPGPERWKNKSLARRRLESEPVDFLIEPIGR